MHHLAGSPNVISIKGAYEDTIAVHVVMELCEGGELFDRIVERGHYTERKAAKLARTIVSVIEACHSLGVMHRDLKPENFLFVSKDEDSPLKAIDFGLSTYFKPGLVMCPSFKKIYSFSPSICILEIYFYFFFTNIKCIFNILRLNHNFGINSGIKNKFTLSFMYNEQLYGV